MLSFSEPPLPPPEGRMELLQQPSMPLVIIDYSHTPKSLELTLKAIKMYSPDRKLVCLFGCGGDRDKEKRPLMGHVATKLADNVIITTDNNRSEAFEDILSDILKGADQSIPLTSLESREKAIEWTLKHCTEKDVVLLAGKGHERFISYNGKNYPFDERSIVLNYFKAKKLERKQLKEMTD